MQIVILCGGLATRLGNRAKNVPKSMIEIEGKPFLEYQIENLKKNKIKDIVLCVGHLSEKIISYFDDGSKFDVNIKYSYDGDNLLGPIGAVKNAESLLDDVFFTLYGDSYVFLNFKEVYSYFLKKKKLALMTVYKNCDKYDASNVVIKEGLIKEYDTKKTKDMIYIDYGVSIFNKEALKIIPSNTFVSTKDFFSILIEKNNLLAFEVEKRFYQIGNPESLREFMMFIQSLKNNYSKQKATKNINRIC